MMIYKACSSLKAPVVITGDLCFQYAFDTEYINTFVKNDINLVLFNRTELAPDIANYNLENLLWYFRRGSHYQNIEDITQLVNVIKHVRDGEPLNNRFFKLPFKKMAPAYDWKCPR